MKKFIFILFVCVSIFFVAICILSGLKREGYFKDITLNYNLTLKENNIIYSNEYRDNKLLGVLINNTNYINASSLDDYIFTNDFIYNYVYGVKIDYYTKLFRHSDLFGVYIDIKDSISNNTFIKDIVMNGDGSPFGYLVSSKKLSNENIEKILYYLKLKPKLTILIYYIIFLIYLYFIIKLKRFVICILNVVSIFIYKYYSFLFKKNYIYSTIFPIICTSPPH